MRRMRFLASRNAREILRDPISVGFGVAFPILLLLLLSFLNRHIPAEAHMTLFEPEQLAPGVSVFSLSFLALFSALLLSRDRSSALILRLYASPLTGRDFILGYLLPMLPMALAQTLVCLLAAIPLGLPVSWRILACTAVNVPIALVNLALGMLCGTLLPEKAVGGMCGALLTNVSAWLSGIWFSLDLGGKVFRRIAYALPFANAVDAARAALAADWGGMFPQLWIVLAWAFGLLTAAIVIFRRKMTGKINFRCTDFRCTVFFLDRESRVCYYEKMLRLSNFGGRSHDLKGASCRKERAHYGGRRRGDPALQTAGYGPDPQYARDGAEDRPDG